MLDKFQLREKGLLPRKRFGAKGFKNTDPPVWGDGFWATIGYWRTPTRIGQMYNYEVREYFEGKENESENN